MEKRWNTIRKIWRNNQFLTILVVGASMFLIGFIIGTVSSESQPEWLSNFVENFWAEALGITLTVAVIDRVYALSRRNDRKLRLFNQLKSRANSVAVDALEQLCREGWLKEALDYYFDEEKNRVVLRRLEFQQADLNGVEITDVDLRTSKFPETDMRNASLIGCDLAFSDIDRAFLGQTDLRGCDLYGVKGKFAIHEDSDPSILPDGTVWGSQNYSQVDITRFSDEKHPQYQETRIRIHEIRADLGLSPLSE